MNETSSEDRYVSMGLPGALVANAIVIGVVAGFTLMSRFDPDLFYRSAQEDEWLEWGTFWAFLLAAGLFGYAFVRRRAAGVRFPWFHAGLALFCFGVAMEEISWGQRVLGYRPPSYFLEHNFQQELNLHNVLESGLRMFAMKFILLGYGVVLPVLALFSWVRSGLSVLEIEAAPAELAPGFAVGYAIYEAYPLKFTGEIVELMLGLAFVFVAQLSLGRVLDAPRGTRLRSALAIFLSAVLVMSLGGATAAVSRIDRSTSPLALEAARVELAALQRDFRSETRRSGGQLPTKCGLHKRLYSYREKYNRDFLSSSAFAGLQSKGLPEERAEFLLDPWNSPYWIRDNCEGSRVVFVYSFGPNRRRDSTRRELREDDLGAWLVAKPDPADGLLR